MHPHPTPVGATVRHLIVLLVMALARQPQLPSITKRPALCGAIRAASRTVPGGRAAWGLAVLPGVLEDGEREGEKYYTYPALKLIQVLPGHPLADSKR